MERLEAVGWDVQRAVEIFASPAPSAPAPQGRLTPTGVRVLSTLKPEPAEAEPQPAAAVATRTF